MRPILLLLFGVLIFCLVLGVVQAVLAVDAFQMQLAVAALVGVGPEGGFRWHFSARLLSALQLATVTTGMLLSQLGRLLYRRA